MRTQHTRLRSEPKLRGDLQIEVRKASTGRLLRRMAIQNTITYDGLNSPLFLWAQDAILVTDYQIAKLWAGTNATPPTRGDLALGTPLPTNPVSGGVITLAGANRTVLTTTSELVITGQLDTAHANGYTLTEIGLFLGNGQLFARQVHPPIPKTSAITVTYSWRIAVSA